MVGARFPLYCPKSTSFFPTRIEPDSGDRILPYALRVCLAGAGAVPGHLRSAPTRWAGMCAVLGADEGRTDWMSERPAKTNVAAAELPVVPGYEVLSELGRGAMGVVYRARQAASGRTVALKMIRDSALAGPQERGRFRIEAEAAA